MNTTPRPPTYTPGFRIDAVKRFMAGTSVPELAEQLKVPEPVLHLWLKKAEDEGVVMPARPAPEQVPAANHEDDMAAKKKKQWRPPYSAEVKEKACAAYRAGKTITEVANDLNAEGCKVDKSTVWAWVKRDEADSKRPGAPKSNADTPPPKPDTAGLSVGIGERRGGGLDPAVRLKAAEELVDGGKPVRDVAARYKVSDATIYTWARMLREARRANGTPPPTPDAPTLEKVFERKPPPERAKKPAARRQQQADSAQLAFPLQRAQLNGHARAHVMPVAESATMAGLLARNQYLEEQNRKLKRMLGIALDDSIDGGGGHG